jgi:hypothetical protein
LGAEQLTIGGVAHYLQEHGLISPYDRIRAIEAHEATNFVASITLNDGRVYYVKQGRHGNSGSGGKLRREAGFYRLVLDSERWPHLNEVLPEIRLHDENNDVLVSASFSENENLLNRHVKSQRPHPVIALRLGRAMARVHNETQGEDKLEWTAPSHDPLGFVDTVFNRLTPEFVSRLPADSIQLLAAIQRVPEFGVSLEQLYRERRNTCLVHGDLRLINVIHGSAPGPGSKPLTILDWEHCHLGDPIWDVGSIVGDYLGLWIFSIPVRPGGEPTEWFRQATFPFAAAQRAARSFWAGYRAERSGFAAHDLNGIMQFAGLFLVGRVIAHMTLNSVVIPGSLIGVQVANKIVADPEWAAERILGEVPEC